MNGTLTSLALRLPGGAPGAGPRSCAHGVSVSSPLLVRQTLISFGSLTMARILSHGADRGGELGRQRSLRELMGSPDRTCDRVAVRAAVGDHGGFGDPREEGAADLGVVDAP